MTVIRPKDRDIIIQSLRSGVVPSRGLQHIQVGRNRETEEFLRDLDRIADGGSTFRLITGEYGAGKTFFLSLVRAVALEKKLVTVHADLNPDRRLQSTNGQARSLINAESFYTNETRWGCISWRVGEIYFYNNQRC
jgi:ABC-type molybdenum transport system ATPase subunit/photorepair protein PhrA